jgi:hypothetical protein
VHENISICLALREMQMKTILRSHLTMVKMTILKITNDKGWQASAMSPGPGGSLQAPTSCPEAGVPGGGSTGGPRIAEDVGLWGEIESL